MADFTLRQGGVVAKLSQLSYRPDEGFQEANTWYVAEASISAHSDAELNDGPAAMEHDGKQFPITVSVLESEPPADEDGEDEDDEWKNPVCEIEIGYTEGLPMLAKSLGLV